MTYNFTSCTLCPRACSVDRTKGAGFCGAGEKIKVAKAYLHLWEEPCISGENGSGAVFFSGCSLKCCFCQNYKISAENFGEEISEEQLGEIFLNLQSKGAHNINLVNPTHFVPQIINALDTVRYKLNIPIVYNSGGYEHIETLKKLEGYIDIYLPDFKYYNNDIAEKYSSAPNYYDIVIPALEEMFRQVGKITYDDNGMLKKGMIIRHLALPNYRQDSVKVLETIAEKFYANDILISLMSQYTPFYKSHEHKELSRRIFTFEYNFVSDRAVSLGLKGFMQEKSSAKEEYTPDFNLEGINKINK